jgi:hypothetical protein
MNGTVTKTKNTRLKGIAKFVSSLYGYYFRFSRKGSCLDSFGSIRIVLIDIFQVKLAHFNF